MIEPPMICLKCGKDFYLKKGEVTSKKQLMDKNLMLLMHCEACKKTVLPWQKETGDKAIRGIMACVESRVEENEQDDPAPPTW